MKKPLQEVWDFLSKIVAFLDKVGGAFTPGGMGALTPAAPGVSPTGPLLMPGFQRGGIVTRPTLAMVGEQGPEAVVPLGRAGGMFLSQPLIVRVVLDGRVIAEAHGRLATNEEQVRSS